MKNLFKDKRIKYGTYSTVVAMIFLAILVMINLVVGQFNTCGGAGCAAGQHQQNCDRL